MVRDFHLAILDGVNALFRVALTAAIREPVAEARAGFPSDVADRLLSAAINDGIRKAAGYAAPGDATPPAAISAFAHAPIVKFVGVGLRGSVEELAVFSVGHFKFADLVCVGDCAVAGAVSGIAGVADDDRLRDASEREAAGQGEGCGEDESDTFVFHVLGCGLNERAPMIREGVSV